MKFIWKFLACCGVLISSAALADWSLVNMPRGVTPISKSVYDLHMTVFWIMVVIGVIVFGVMFYAILHHRKSRGHEAAQFHENTTVEILWALIPLIILVVMAIPASKVLFKMEDNSEAEVNVKIIGYQWKWEYQYIDEGIHFFSNLATPPEQIQNKAPKGEHYLLEVDHPLVLPVGKKVRFLITSNDVVHSWWVPELGFKKDAIPGYMREAWAIIEKPGTYRGQCAELCGSNHGYMPIVIEAVSSEAYQAWLTEQKTGKKISKIAVTAKPLGLPELMRAGEKVYKTSCVACHQLNGEGMPGVVKAIKNSPIAKGPIEKHIDIVINGKKGTSMQAFGPQLSDEEIAAVVTYERNAFGNNMKDMAQPEHVKKLHSEGAQ